MPSSRILPTGRIFGTELTEMKPQLLPRGLFHSTSVPKSRNRSTRLYERFGGPAYFTRLRSKPAAVTDALLLQGPAGRVPLPAWELKRCCPPTPASPAVACCPRPRPRRVSRTRRAGWTGLRARAAFAAPAAATRRSLRRQKAAESSSAGTCRKQFARAPAARTAQHLHTEEERARPRMHVSSAPLLPRHGCGSGKNAPLRNRVGSDIAACRD